MIFNIFLKNMNQNSQHNYTHNITCHSLESRSIRFYYTISLVIVTLGGCPRMRNSILVIQYIVVYYKANPNMMWSKSLNSYSRTGS